MSQPHMNDNEKQSNLIQKINIEDQPLSLNQINYLEDQTMHEQVKPATYCQLFHFADNVDWIIMAIAAIFSLGNGISIVFYAIPIKDLINAFSANVKTDQIVQAAMKSVYGFLINSGILFVNCWLMTAAWTITSERQMNRARKQYFAALLKQQIAWYDRNKPAQICSKMYIQVSKVQQGLVTNMTSVLNKISMGISGIVMALFVGSQMALVMICFLPVMMISGFIRGYYTKRKDMYLQTKKIKLDSDVIQVFDNIKTVKMLSSQDYESEQYEKNLKKQQQKLWQYGWKGALAFSFFFFCIIANYSLGFWCGSRLVANQVINYNTGQKYNTSQVVVIFFTLYISNLSLSGLPDSIASFSVSRYSMKKIINMVKRQPKMKDGHTNLPKNISSIKLHHVSFKYDKPLFTNLNLNISKGTTAIIGQSGCGKSTIIALLMRFYDVSKGSIQFFDGKNKYNINQIKNNNLREVIGYVGQQPVLIGKTIRQVLMAQEYTDNYIYETLQIVKAEKFVREIGLFAQFKSVSGGQKQRLAIARALLRKPKILILDQSTSALDPKTEQQVLKSITKSGVDFVIMVAHRPQTLVYADRIIKINKDKILFEGTYKNLCEKSLIQDLQKNQQSMKKQILKQQKDIDKMQQNMLQIKQKLILTQQHKKQTRISQKQQQKFKTLNFQMNYFISLMAFNKDKWYLYALGFLGAIYFGCIFPLFSYLISKIIFILQSIANADQHNLPIYQKQAFQLSKILFIVSFGSLLFTTLRWVIFQYFNQRIGYLAKSTAFRRLINKNYYQIEQDQAQTYSYMINKSCEDLKPLAGNFLPMIIQNLITLVVGLTIAFIYSWQITLSSLVILPLVLLSSKMMMSFNHGMQSNTQQIHKKNHQLIITSVMYIRTVRSCHLEQRIYQKYGKQLDDALKVSIKYGNLAGILFGIGQTLISLSFALIFLFGAILIKYNLIGVQDLYTSIFAVMFAGVQAGGNLYFLGQLEAAKTGSSIYFQIICQNHPDEIFIQEASQPWKSNQTGGTIKFQNVRYNYRTRTEPVFKNLSFQVKANQKLAIVGQSGSGKSTLANLLFRLYPLDSGSIIVDGNQIGKIAKKKLSRILGIVMQQPVLFNRSAYQNVKYNTTQATADDVKLACKISNAYDFIVDANFGIQNQFQQLSQTQENSELPPGFKKIVGPRGSYLSGGQKQRISIARALVRKPKVLILDQATSALDTQNEKHIQNTIEKLNNITQIIIAHRLSTIQNCDRILVLKNGVIVQQGNYNQLIKKGGYFSGLNFNKS